jgi:hypothetical protein
MKDANRCGVSVRKDGRGDDSICDLEGGAALCAWFEGIPPFHDATLRKLELRQGALGRLTFRMESEVDAQGYFVLYEACGRDLDHLRTDRG